MYFIMLASFWFFKYDYLNFQRGDIHGQWLPLVIPASVENMGPIHTEAFTLAGLEPATIYEAVISSKNVFGWSKPSKIFKFATVGIGN